VELQEPYGIPYRSLVPEGIDNLLVACRGGGFSSMAASSCRLSRSMMQLGQAAGEAAALATQRGVAFPDVDPGRLRDRLRAEHVGLSWPPGPEMLGYLRENEPEV
jgi:hypothetical protein